MATKIDLLPSYVGLRRWFRRIRWISAALFAVVAAVLWVVWFKKTQQLDALKEELAVNQRIAKQTQDAEAKEKKATDEASPIQGAVDFMVQASQTGGQRAAVVRLIKGYIYPDALVSLIDISDGQTCKITASVARPDDYYKFLLDLRRGWTNNNGMVFADEPKASGIPGFPSPIENSVEVQQAMATSGEPRPISLPLSISATAKLKDPLTVPVESGGAAPAAPGAPGAPGPGPQPPPPPAK